CCTLSALRPSVTTMWSTYACRRGSDLAFHAGFLSRVKLFPATYFEIRYGPSEIVCCRSCALSGTYCMYSTGRAEVKPIARMFGKSGAGARRGKTRGGALGATTPAGEWPVRYVAI